MRKGIIYGVTFLAVTVLGSTHCLADNPFNWQPYERDDQTTEDDNNSQEQEAPSASQE
jgi:hypothetical protein